MRRITWQRPWHAISGKGCRKEGQKAPTKTPIKTSVKGTSVKVCQNLWPTFSAACCTLLLSYSAWASQYRLALPLVYGETELGELAVELEGMSLQSVSLASLQTLLTNKVSEEWWNQHYPESNADYISIEKLQEHGLDISLNSETLLLSVVIDPDVFSEQTIHLGSGYPAFTPSPSGFVSWLNNFNIGYDHYWEDDNESWNSSVDWISQINVGGARGVNLLLANHYKGDDEQHEFYRGEWIAYHDNPNLPLRVSAGDLISGDSGHITGMSLGGFSIESRYADLQPDREIGPQSSQQLVLLESAYVEVFVNGERVSGGRLDAGRYNLQNLILDNGANDITVVVDYLSGQQEVLTFTQFYNAQLLEKGLVDYAFSVGKPIMYGSQEIEYEDLWIATGYVEYGLTDWLTVGTNGLAAQEGFIVGALSTLRSKLGNVTLRYSFSDSDNSDTGNIASLDYENSIFGSGENQSPNLRLALEYADTFSTQPWQEEQSEDEYARVLANYFWQISTNFDLNLSGNYAKYRGKADEINGSMVFSWRQGNLTLGLGGEYEDSERYPETDSRVLLTLDYNWHSRGGDYQVGVSYHSENERNRAYVNNDGFNYVGDVGMRIEAERDDYQETQRARVNYTANRFSAESEVSRNAAHESDVEQYQGSVRLATAIGMVDGSWGWGRPAPGPFVVAELHPTLSEAHADLDVDPEGRAIATATPHFNGLVTLSKPFAGNSFDYNVSNAPIGYDWGEGKLEVAPGSATGHYLLIGSDASYTASGFLRDESGTAIEYRHGRVVMNDTVVEFFTNKQGRFYIQGLRPGDYTLELYGLNTQPIKIAIPASSKSLIDLGSLSVLCQGECDEQ